jgi:membrane protein
MTRGWNAHEIPRLGAALAFYTLLSIAPLVILVMSVAGLVFGHSAAQNQLLGQVGSMIGRQGSDAVKSMIEQAHAPLAGTLASLIGVVTLLFGASGVFSELRSALNEIWGVEYMEGGAVWRTIQERFFSIGMVLAVGFLLLVSLLISAGLAAIGKFWTGLLPIPAILLGTINFLISLAGVTTLFALMFRFAKTPRRLPSAATTSMQSPMRVELSGWAAWLPPRRSGFNVWFIAVRVPASAV